MSFKRRIIACLAAFWAVPALAEDIPIDEQHWDFSSETGFVTVYKGMPALSLYNAEAWLRDMEFSTGTIEYKVSFPKDRGFVGLMFRAQDRDNYEHFYLRPHQSGMADANQYTPVFHGNTGWQIYYGPRFSVPVDYPYGEWIDVKLVIADDSADVYINSDEPVLHVEDLLRDEASGRIGFDSFLSHAFITDVNVTPQESPVLAGEPVPPADLPENLVTDWQVAGPFAPVPASAPALPDMSGAQWQSMTPGETGFVNLGSVAERAPDSNTLLARIRVDAAGAGSYPLHFGYSDKVTVFVNGTPVYAGDNTYRTRDYRYLGTVGLFDTILLPLQAGRNEITFAVEEAFGGWAIGAAFESMEGLDIVN